MGATPQPGPHKLAWWSVGVLVHGCGQLLLSSQVLGRPVRTHLQLRQGQGNSKTGCAKRSNALLMVPGIRTRLDVQARGGQCVLDVQARGVNVCLPECECCGIKPIILQCMGARAPLEHAVVPSSCVEALRA